MNGNVVGQGRKLARTSQSPDIYQDNDNPDLHFYVIPLVPREEGSRFIDSQGLFYHAIVISKDGPTMVATTPGLFEEYLQEHITTVTIVDSGKEIKVFMIEVIEHAHFMAKWLNGRTSERTWGMLRP